MEKMFVSVRFSVPGMGKYVIALPRDGKVPSPGQDCLEAALYYAGVEGLPVFPLNGKIPFAGGHGFYDATTDCQKIVNWWKRWPQANIGVPTGKISGWLVVDIDPRHDGLASLQRLLAVGRRRAEAAGRRFVPLPPTRAAYSGGGGVHLMFSLRDDLDEIPRNAAALGGYTGLDMRGEGGYIVVPPSRHESGQRYRWLNSEPLAPFPDLLLDLYRARQQWEERQQQAPFSFARDELPADPDFYLDIAVHKARAGTRHSYALYLACRLIADVGMSIEQAEPIMREYVRRVPQGDHPFTMNEALGCLRWAWEHV